jgi:hypothetical protein
MFDYLFDRRVKCLSNPFGTVFNPVSIQRQLAYVNGDISLDNDNIIVSRDTFLHFEAHSKFFAKSREELLKKLENERNNARLFIQSAHFIFITLGTALVYERLENEQVVSNCHKQSDKLFKRRFLTQIEVTKSLEEMKRIINIMNPSCEIIFTLSPVRHLRSGMIDNNASKAILRSSIHEICDDKNIGYFPSYEIMMDDLRDYRYYETDMIHPSSLALSYICEKFESCYCDQNTQIIFRKVEKYNAIINHKPMNINSNEYEKHLENIERLKSELLSLGVELI